MSTSESSDRTIEQLKASIRERHSTLTPSEAAWRDRQVYLQERGYMLRPRYRPGWKPSWELDTSLDFLQCEDFHFLPLRPSLVDATRISDGRLVYIKRVGSQKDELKIALSLGLDEQREDGRNHCVPILDHFPDADDAFTYIVMPFLRPVDEPPFETVENVVEFVDQLLEGLVFMHERGVAHRDCAMPNIMMDADDLFPEGFHPVNLNDLPDSSDEAPVLPRANRSVNFYYVDFGISVHIPNDSANQLVVGDDGRDQDVPELSTDVPYDPFKVDIFILGNLLREEFEVKFTNLSFLRSLAGSMTATNPASRPNAIEALAKWQGIRSHLLSFHRAWRLRPRDESWRNALSKDFHSLGYLGPYFAHRIRFKAHTVASSLPCITRK
ncbi:hypothetical protein PHLGIDRAFT_37667 [Phlebiopsis gigantea 11061_1 CR5-6]|uniref:Protein kinase domain-containing protein n=1 Tax=Phlebiopsis gigantea (strain 11061_1 CR5-6) TaxID=745531 RepID=A0A0C3RRX1_PHLG1|nr:hypothetical protein PHLGIDRAFT_37667 [Phlebiopsis gigantea 11061_1 CR5-6]